MEGHVWFRRSQPLAERRRLAKLEPMLVAALARVGISGGHKQRQRQDVSHSAGSLPVEARQPVPVPVNEAPPEPPAAWRPVSHNVQNRAAGDVNRVIRLVIRRSLEKCTTSHPRWDTRADRR